METARRAVLTASGSVLLLVLACLLPAAAVEVNPPLPKGRVTIGGRVHLTVEVCRTMEEKARGLSGRPGLRPGWGMAFPYEQPQPVTIWMKDMRFPLDILWVRQGRIVHIEKHAPPLLPAGPVLTYTATADLVLEVPDGYTDRERIRVGDRVRPDLP